MVPKYRSTLLLIRVRKKNSNSSKRPGQRRIKAMKNFLLCVFIIFLLATRAIAQQPAGDKTKANQVSAAPQAKERRGAIKGRVINDNGQPLANININVFTPGLVQGQRRNLGTDEEGRFEIDDLSPAVYSIVPSAPGYVISMNASDRRYYRIGDDVTLTMIKGGVITGTVRNAAGEPVVGVMVSAWRVRDAEGKPSTRSTATVSRDRMTDDRGIYRIYGIEPGAYIIVANGRTNFYTGEMSKYAGDVKTYHPSSTRETAAEVMVQNGQEVSGIDINYRGGKGHTISGTVLNANIDNGSINVSLIHAASGVNEAGMGVPIREGKPGFALYAVPDGEYLLRAELFTPNMDRNRYASPPRRVIVKGNDVSGLELTLAPLASISGILVLEQAPVANSKAQCEKSRVATLEETILTFRKDTKGDSPEQKWPNLIPPLAANDKGEFAAYRLLPGTYHLSVNLPSETWYIKSAGLSASSKSNQPNYRGQQLSDVATKGIAVKAGEHVATLTVTIAEGAASLSGTVKMASEREALPPRLRVYLIPGERENTNDILRFFQSEVQFDGAFSFSNIPPGKYWVLSRISDEESLGDNTPRPIYWDLEGRTTLVKEATAANSLLELQPCRKLTDYALRHGLPQATVTPVIKK
jgi:hypothetical protein